MNGQPEVVRQELKTGLPRPTTGIRCSRRHRR
jgi:hypothetical protein